MFSVAVVPGSGPVAGVLVACWRLHVLAERSAIVQYVPVLPTLLWSAGAPILKGFVEKQLFKHRPTKNNRQSIYQPIVNKCLYPTSHNARFNPLVAFIVFHLLLCIDFPWRGVILVDAHPS